MYIRIFVSYIVMMNIIAFLLYGIDKRKAIKNQWRISEFHLIAVAFIGGSLGALLGMWLFHHKTKHWKFKTMIPLFLIIHCLLIYLFII